MVTGTSVTSTDVLQTIFVGVQLLVLIGAAVFGWFQLREAQRLREAQARPFVVLDVENARRPGLFDLVVKNMGRTIARNVRFAFVPRLESSMGHVDIDRLKMFRDGIVTLAPGKEIRTLFDSGPKRYEAKLPDVYAVTIAYEGEHGKAYSETLDLDFGLYWNRMYVAIHDLHDVHRELSKIRQEMGRWTASLGGVLCVSPLDVERRNKRIEEELGADPDDA